MTESNHIEQGSKGINRLIFVAFCFGVAVVLVLMYIFGKMPVPKGDLVDSDCYVRLTRVTDLYETGNWYHPARMKSNTPYGDTLPWSRLFDVLLIAGAAPLSTVMGFHEALFWCGVVISPFLFALTMIALNWSTRAILNRDATFLVVLLFLSQMVLLSYCQPGRPDHHSLMIFLFMLSVGFLLRLVLNPFKYSTCYAAGLIGALSIWVSVESMVPVCLSLGILTLLWIINNGDFLRKSFHFGLSLFVFSILFMLLERPLSEWKTVQFDCFSIVYACLLGLIAVFWSVALLCEHQFLFFDSRKGRIVCCVLGGGVVALAMRVLFPRVYGGPMVDVDPRIIPIWFSQVNEVQPLIGSAKLLGMAVQLIGSAIVSLPFLLYLLLRCEKKDIRNGWMYITVMTAAFILIASFQVRWGVYAQALLSIAMAELLSRILQWRKEQGHKLVRALRNGLVTLFFVFGFIYVGILTGAIICEDQSSQSNKRVSLIPVCEYLNKLYSEKGKPLRILTHLSYAGEILYRTPNEVLGSHYHRNGPGIMDSYHIMTAKTNNEAIAIIRKRGLDIILICPDSIDTIFRQNFDKASTFYQRLQEDPIPKGLNQIELPKDLSDNFLMFEVVEDDQLN